MPPNPEATSTQDTHTTSYETDADLWQQRWRIAYTNQLPMFKRFADWYDGMYTIVNTKQYSLWRSKVYMPILASKAWNLISKFMSLKPGFEVRPRQEGVNDEDLALDPALMDKAIKAQLKLEYDYDNPNGHRPIREKLMASLIDCAVTGTGLAKVNWCVDKIEKYEHPVRSDGTIDMTKEKVTTSYRGHNDLVPVNIFNVFVAPASTDLYSAPWIIIKDWKTLDQLKQVNEGKGVEIYKNLDKLENARATGDIMAIYKKSRNRLTVQYDPVIADKTVDFLEIYECYDKSANTIITFANAGQGASKSGGYATWVEIRRQKMPYWHGKYPLVRFCVKIRPYDFWGEGIWETNQKLQVAMNDIFNHYLDNWNLSVDGMLMAQESAGINDYIVEPGGLITYRTEEPKQFKFPEPNPASLNAVVEQLMQAIESNTISNYSTGSPNSDVDKTRGTKGGIMAIQQAADDLVAFMRMNFQETIREIGHMWMSNNAQFMSQNTLITVPHKGQVIPVHISPADLQPDMELRVDEASMIPVSDDQQKEQFQAFVGQLLALQNASTQQSNLVGTKPIALNHAELMNELAEKYGFRNVRALFDQVPQGPPPAHQLEIAKLQAKNQPAQQTPPPPPKLNELINYKDAPDDIKRQIEEQAGLQPSKMAVNSQNPTTMQANRKAHQMATELHAQGLLHPAVMDMVNQHLGYARPPAGESEPIGEPPTPPQGAPA